MPQIHAARRARAQEMVRALGAGAVLVTARPNVRYLTGLASSNAALLLPPTAKGCWRPTPGTRWPPSATRPTWSC